MNITQLYRDYGIPFVTEGHKHSREGWVNTACPFCTGNPGMHLGFNEQNDYYVCWRCGGHPIIKTLAELLKIPNYKAKEIARLYDYINSDKKEVQAIIQPFKFPSNTSDELLAQHRSYLIKRNFDPDQIQKDWRIKATGLSSKLDNIDYKMRLVIPVYWDGQIVTFLTRAIADTKMKYLTCPAERELINIKHTLYGRQDCWSDLGILVEGATDVWRIGKEHGVGVYGIKYTNKQVRLIAKNFKRVPVLFDDDPQAQEQAKKMVADLKFRGVDSWNVVIKGDPAAMSQDNINHLVSELKTYKIK